MKMFIRITVFILTFVLGVQVVALTSWASDWTEIPTIVVSEEIDVALIEKAVEPQAIRVMYAGMARNRKEKEVYLRFVVHNGKSGPITYGAKGENTPFPEVRVNGHPMPDFYRCGSGMELYSIDPGKSAEFRVGVYEFQIVPRKSDLITVGFYFRDQNSDLAEEIYSEPFMLPNAFRRSIDQEKLWAEE